MGVQKIELSYGLGQARSGDALVRNPLMDLLHAVHEHGSISAAARALGLSYRHVWGELKRWEQVLAHPLIVWEKGQPALLSEFGSKLLWAERQAQARLSPQIAALQADLERVFAVAFDDSAHVLTLYASHDDALVALREHAQGQGPGGVHLDIRYTGSVDAIRALNEGRCVLAGFHTLDQPTRSSRAACTYRDLLQPGQHKIIGFGQRWQGLLVPKGNPQNLQNLQDVVARRARFATRSLGSGTRIVLEDLLEQSALDSSSLNISCPHEPSHAAIAQAVGCGQADVGLGPLCAARARGLDFVPLVREHYHLVCLRSALDSPGVAALRQLLQAPNWQDRLSAVAGYSTAHCGQILPLTTMLPWWRFRRPKSAISP